MDRPLPSRTVARHCSCNYCWSRRRCHGRLAASPSLPHAWWCRRAHWQLVAASGFYGMVTGLVSGLVPLVYVLYRRAVRFRKFNFCLPDAVDLIARSLRAGHSLPSALVTVAEEIDDPLGPEFRRCADEMNFGMPFREAMMNLFRRFPIQDLQFLVSAILLQRETGGNLAELLDKTAAVLRARIQLQQKVGYTRARPYDRRHPHWACRSSPSS